MMKNEGYKTFQTPEEVNNFLNSLDVFHYAAFEEKYFEDTLASLGSYERQTTFYSDLSIAERYGTKAIEGTVDTVLENWMSDIKFITEFAMSLNYKAWEWSYRKNEELTELYTELFYDVQNKIFEHYKDDHNSLLYYYAITD